MTAFIALAAAVAFAALLIGPAFFGIDVSGSHPGERSNGR